MNASEKVAYLKGLMEGMNFDTTTNEGKILKAICEILDDMSVDIEDMNQEVSTLNDYIEEIDEDLGDLEELIYDEDDCCCCDDDDCDCCDEDYDDDFDDDQFFEVTCPNCQEKVVLDDSIDPSRVICPNCGTEFSDIIDK